ncbi:unnamed protein product [Prunus armeniaca]
MALHNFIRIHSMTDVEFPPYDDDDELLPQTDDGRTSMEETIIQENVTCAREMDDERETIANSYVYLIFVSINNKYDLKL